MGTGDRSEDQFIPLSFVGSSTPSPTADVITARINDRTIKSGAYISVRYQDVLTFTASAKSGATLSYSTTSSTCSISGNKITILKGSGICDIAVSSPGNAQYTATTVHYFFKINLGLQKLTISTIVRKGTNITLPTATSFGEKISYEQSSTTNCTLTGNTLSFNKVGACMIKATALAKSDTYASLNQTLNFKIR